MWSWRAFRPQKYCQPCCQQRQQYSVYFPVRSGVPPGKLLKYCVVASTYLCLRSTLKISDTSVAACVRSGYSDRLLVHRLSTSLCAATTNAEACSLPWTALTLPARSRSGFATFATSTAVSGPFSLSCAVVCWTNNTFTIAVHKKELDDIKDIEKRQRRMVELNAQEQYASLPLILFLHDRDMLCMKSISYTKGKKPFLA